MTAQPDNIFPFDSAKPEAKVVFVSPDIATRWLSRNTKNRRVRTGTVRKYARDMAAGKWQLTGESVKFSPDGTLLDGQHRLAAVVESGASVPMFVMRGINPGAQRVMDTGRARTAADALSMKDQSHASMLAAAARIALGVTAGLPDPGKYDPTHAEIEAYVDTHPGLVQACAVAQSVARRTDCPPAIVAYAYWQMAQVNREDADAFWVCAADKVGLSPGDPVIALTNRLAESRRNRERLTKRIYLSLIYRAWNARRAGKTMRFIRVNSPAGGLVPIPDLR